MKHFIIALLVVILSVLSSLCIGISLAESPETKKIWEWTPRMYTKVLRQYDISEKDIETILNIIECESNFVSKQSDIWRNGKRELSFGIAQIHLPSHPDVTKEQALDKEFSIHWTAKKWKEGFRGWSCYK